MLNSVEAIDRYTTNIELRPTWCSSRRSSVAREAARRAEQASAVEGVAASGGGVLTWPPSPEAAAPDHAAERLRSLWARTRPLPDATANIHLRAAMQRINAMDPLLGIGSFSTVADQQKYSPAPAGASSSGRRGGATRRFWPPRQHPAAINTWLTQLSAPRSGSPSTNPVREPRSTRHGRHRAAPVRAGPAVDRHRVRRGEQTARTFYLSPVPHDVRTVYFSYTAERFARSAP